MTKNMTKNMIIFLGALSLVALLTFAILPKVLALTPSGGTVTPGTPETAPNDTADSEVAYAGNTTYLTITGFSTTQSWQGYFGNVTGTIQLADASDDVFYNWSELNPQGEIYASTNATIVWPEIQCFNFTANGTQEDSGDETSGGTNIGGRNLTQLEEEFGIAWDDVDGINETFSLAGTHESGGGFSHDLFYTANLQFSAGECLSTHVFADTGLAEDSQFEEIILYDPTTTSVVFASIIYENENLGFDGNDHDFQMLVPENGHGVDVSTTTYYFWVELE